MSFLKRMFGLQSAEELRAEADAAFDEGDWSTAKLAYEKALDKVKGASEEECEALAARIDSCRDGIADSRIAQATEHIRSRNFDLARSDLEGALEVAASEETTAHAQKLLDQLEHTDAVETADIDTDVSDEERLALIAGSWEEPQAREYDSYGNAIEDAVLAMHDERVEEAREALEALLEQADEPRYLWLELGRARLLSGDEEGGTEALRTFLGELTEGEGGESRLAAHLELARLAEDHDDGDAAIAEYTAAIEALEGDPRPHLWLGRYLRAREHPAEAVEVIEGCLELLDSARPDWRVLQELGLAQAEAGRKDEAIETLESVVSFFTSNRLRDFPPDATRTLAELYEDKGRIERAADLYRQLTSGSDADNHPRYHLEAGRLLWELDLADEARRMLQRASALTEDDPEMHAQARQLLAAMEGAETETATEATAEAEATPDTEAAAEAQEDAPEEPEAPTRR